MKRVVAVLIVLALVGAGVLAAVVALSAGDGSDAAPSSRGPAPTSTPDASTTQPPSPDLADYYTQQLDWSDCEGRAECATLTVPLDYEQPTGEKIELALLKVPALSADARIGSLVVNPGGPGAPGTSYAAQADQVFRSPLLEQFDIVGFDPRGTGASAPVDCLDDAQLDDFLASDPDPDTAAEEREYLGWVQKIGSGCAQLSGDLAQHVSTVEAARDMDVLRSALGESTMTYFGASYGTKLGATYADLFPDRVGRMVLDGAVDLSISSRELSLEQAAGFETALRSFVQSCIDKGSCFLGDSVDQGLSRIEDLVTGIDRSPLSTDLDGRELTVGNAFYGIVAPLYNRDYWFILTEALKSAFDGDGSILLRLSDLYSSRNESGGYSDNSAEAIYAINCLDDPYAIPRSKVEANIPAVEPAPLLESATPLPQLTRPGFDIPASLRHIPAGFAALVEKARATSNRSPAA